jgi:hypothetical protein
VPDATIFAGTDLCAWPIRITIVSHSKSITRHTFLAGAALLAGLVAAPGAFAQAPLSRAGAVPTTTRFVTLGCVSRTSEKPERFVITDTRGDKPVVYRLDGDPEQLRVHIGHTLEVKGPLSAAPSSSGAGAAVSAVLKVESLVYISRTCAKPK